MAFGLSLTKQPLKVEYLVKFEPGHINRMRARGHAASAKAEKPIKQPKRDRRAAEKKAKAKRRIAEKSRKRNRRFN